MTTCTEHHPFIIGCCCILLNGIRSINSHSSKRNVFAQPHSAETAEFSFEKDGSSTCADAKPVVEQTFHHTLHTKHDLPTHHYPATANLHCPQGCIVLSRVKHNMPYSWTYKQCTNFQGYQPTVKRWWHTSLRFAYLRMTKTLLQITDPVALEPPSNLCSHREIHVYFFFFYKTTQVSTTKTVPESQKYTAALHYNTCNKRNIIL